MVKLRAVAAGISDVGLQRDHNEDSFAILNEQELYVVADGMGGHRAGDVASRLATDAIVEFFRATAAEDVTWPFHFDSRLSEEENRLLTGIRIANRQIIERSLRSRECHGMGTTIVGALFSPGKGKMFIGHVGDSRAYRVREGQDRPAHPRPLAGQRLPPGHAGAHRGAAQRAPQERDHPRARHAGSRHGGLCRATTPGQAISTCSARTG